ncbi:MAG: hypothetical protein R2879_07185 [Saprospiraceae bacterium]
MQKFLAFVFILSPGFLLAQIPQTQIYLFEIRANGVSSLNLEKPLALTQFNKAGYNNQPIFFNAYDLYFTLQSDKDTSQTDIYALDLIRQEKRQVTATIDAEYSPTPMPDGTHFSVVRVEPDGSQRLWKLPVDQIGKGMPVFDKITNVGYHCWLEEDLVALFLVDEINYLVLAKPSTQKFERIASGIGRCLNQLPDGRLAFVQKATDKTWYIKAYDIINQDSEIISKTLPGVEDFTVLEDGTLLMALGSSIFKKHPALDDNWVSIANLENFSIRNISRLASWKDQYLAIVAQP